MDFRDCRSRRVILIPHCALNQNARVPGAAESPAAVVGLINGLLERDVGILQMPCPELHAFGLERGNVSIRDELQTSEGKRLCRILAVNLVEQVRAYRSCGVNILGVLGKNGSPSCGVEETWIDGVTPGAGVFIQELAAVCRECAVHLDMAGYRDGDPHKGLETVDHWLAAPQCRA